MTHTVLFNPSSIAPASLVNFTIANQVTVAAIGLPPGAYITFEMVLLTSPVRETLGAGCCELSPDGIPTEANWQQLMCCEGQPVRVNAANPAIVLDTPQDVRLRAVLNGYDFNSGIFAGQVVVYPSTSTITNDAMRGCCADPVVVVPPVVLPPVTATVSICPTPACFTWGGTTYNGIAQFVADIRTIVPGATYNAATCTFSAPAGNVFPNLTIAACVPVVVPPAPTVYCPSFRMDLCGCAEIGFAYRDNALRDPAATVAVMGCNGLVDAYIYPAAGVTGVVRHEVPYYDDDGVTVLGYMANQSDCATEVTPVVTVNVAAPNVTLPAPTLVATQVSPLGVVTNTLSNGSTVVSNEPASPC